MNITETVKKIPKSLFKRISKSSNVQTTSSHSNNSKYSPYLSLFDRTDKRVSYEVGRKILRDTQVGTGFDILKYLLSSKKWILTNTEEDTEIYDFINDMLQNMKPKPQTLIKQMVSAIMWGYSVHEKIYSLDDEGRIIIKDLIPIHIKTLQNEPFQYDANGDLKYIHQVSQLDEVYIPADKVLLYTFGSLYDEKEGHGLLYDFLPIVEDKENLKDWFMTFAERNGAPTMLGKTGNGQVSRDEMLNSFDELSAGRTGMVIDIDDEVDVLESRHKGEIFFSGLQYNDNAILRRMFIGNLVMGDNSQTGSYAQSQTQLELGSMVFDGVLEDAADDFQAQIIDPIVEFNFGPKRKSPKISFDKFTSGDMQKLFSIIQPLMQMGSLDVGNSAVQEALALLFKSEAGVEYTNEEPDMSGLGEDFNLPPVEGDKSTEEILKNLEGVNGGTLTGDILNEVV